MLLTQAVVLSLCLCINAHHIRGGRFEGGQGAASSSGGSIGGGASVSNSSTSALNNGNTASSSATEAQSTATSIAAAAAASNSDSSSSSNTADQSGGGGSGSGATLSAANIQAASDSDGGAAEEAGQSPSATDPDNFINFCTGKNTTDGFQVVTGSCNGVVMGDIPASTNMISSIITNPAPGDTLPANTNFTINVQVNNLAAGTFTNPLTTYYSAPQALKNGLVIGHTHVTIQSLGNSLTTSTPPDPQTFAFFKGINDDGNGQGGLSAAVAGGLPAGAYRVCTMTSAANHQPVLMPVAQRGSQDDCTKFLVSDSGSGGAGSGSAASSAASGASQSTTAAAASSATAAASASGSGNSSSSNNGGQSNSGSNKGSRGSRFSKRAFVA